MKRCPRCLSDMVLEGWSITGKHIEYTYWCVGCANTVTLKRGHRIVALPSTHPMPPLKTTPPTSLVKI